MLKEYFICLPEKQESLNEEWKQCLKKLEKRYRAGNRPVKFNVFADIPDFESYIKTRDHIIKTVTSCFGKESPAINVTAHPPEKPFKVAVEALFGVSETGNIKTRYFKSKPYVIIEKSGHKEVWGAGMGSGLFPEDTRKAASAAFSQIIEILRNEDMSLNHIVRQWNYVGNILEVKNGYQNYQIFNEVRSKYYNKFRSVKYFPSATGVGMKLKGVILDFCAIKADEHTRILPISNPLQINAYEYDQQVLKGLPPGGAEIKKPPQFERALLIENRHNPVLFVSGTASIVGQETIGTGNIEKQTAVTINNIKTLTEPERIRMTEGDTFEYSGKFLILRVYIRKQEDFGIVKMITGKNFPGIPAIYLEADICRDDLLMETEAEMVLFHV